MSGKQARRRRQAAAPPPVRRKGARRQASPKVLLVAALAVLVLAGAAVGISLAVTGKSVGPGVYDCLAILGRDACLARIDRALAR